jgi:excinuclease ABC subunit C
MGEMLSRRFSREKEGDKRFAEPPDLLLIDGGRGQAAAVCQALEGLGVSVPVFGMKKDDRHRTESLVDRDGNEIDLSLHPGVFSFIGRIQEETHRFALEYQKNLRGKKGYASELDEVPGVGEKRKAKLLKAFGGIRAVKSATLEELIEKGGLPKAAAEAVFRQFHNEEDTQ